MVQFEAAVSLIGALVIDRGYCLAFAVVGVFAALVFVGAHPGPVFVETAAALVDHDRPVGRRTALVAVVAVEPAVEIVVFLVVNPFVIKGVQNELLIAFSELARTSTLKAKF